MGNWIGRKDSNVYHLDQPEDRLRFMLTFYLKTAPGPQDDPRPLFSLPRSENVDHLLRRRAAGADIADELVAALTHHRGAASPADPGNRAGWAREAASQIHPINGLERRLERYLELLSRHAERAPEEAVVVSMLAEPPAEAALLARRRRATPAPVDSERAFSWVEERSYFKRRLNEELSRCGRLNAELSVVLVHVHEPYETTRATRTLLEDSIRRGLREYDIFCHTAADEYRMILPGADASSCARVVQRLRYRTSASVVDGPAVQISFGTATWPEHGARATDLLEEAGAALLEDRHRQPHRAGAGSPATAHSAGPQGYPATVTFEGFPQEVKVQAVQTPQGIRLRLPLRFLRRGSAIQLAAQEDRAGVGVLTEAVLGRGPTADAVPTLYVDVTQPGEG